MTDKYLLDMDNLFLDSDNIDKDKLIYSYDNSIPDINEKDLLNGFTYILPGNINGECNMTKGHTHKIPSAEVYYCINGEGIILVQKNNEESISYLINKGSKVYIEPGYGHRAINTGENNLELLCVCRADAGHDYNFSFNHRIIDKRIK